MRHWQRSGMPGLGVPALLASMVIGLAAASPVQAQQDSTVLFQNVRIFDGKNQTLSAPSNVLVRNNKIEKISAAAIADLNKRQLFDLMNVDVLVDLDDVAWPHLNHESLGDRRDDLLMKVMPRVVLLQKGVHAREW